MVNSNYIENYVGYAWTFLNQYIHISPEPLWIALIKVRIYRTINFEDCDVCNC